MTLTQAQLAAFGQDGFLVLPGYVDAAECLKLRDHAESLEAQLREDQDHITVFSATDQSHADDEWFLSSGDKTRGFFESDGSHLNKIGHAMHDLDPIFDRFTRATGFGPLADQLGVRSPQLVQSMYIFKHPGVGGEVTWHTDHTFLWTEPRSVIGFWVAIDDANTENGCLWAIPGGHEIPVKSRFIRSGSSTTTEVFDDSSYPIEEAVALETPRGTLVLLNGALPHWSDVNRSPHPRQAFTLHVIDGEASWPEDNWLQRPATLPFRGF